jgi:hypothetical protein
MNSGNALEQADGVCLELFYLLFESTQEPVSKLSVEVLWDLWCLHRL